MKSYKGLLLRFVAIRINLKRNVILLLFITLFISLQGFPNEEADLRISSLVNSDKYEDQQKALNLMKHTNEPSDTMIQSILEALGSPSQSIHFPKDYQELIVKWGEYAIPQIAQILEKKTVSNPALFIRIVRNISKKHGQNAIVPIIPGLLKFIKEREFEEKSIALQTLADLKDLADDAIPDLTDEMFSSRNVDFQWSVRIALALKEIAGNDYPPIQPFLHTNKAISKQDAYAIDNDAFKLEIGYDISSLNFKVEPVIYKLLVGPTQALPFKRIIYKRINYDIGFENNKIEYISTNDRNFMTDEGFKVEDSFEALKQMGYEEFIEIQGWGYYVPLKSGWNAGFSILENNTNKSLSNDSKIVWFFISREIR